MDLNAPTKFGDLLRQYRRAAGLTQEELAARAQMSPRAISDLERGARSRPWRETIQLLAGALALGPTERAVLESAARPASPAGRTPVVGETEPSDATPRHNLPLAVTSFIGREREVAEAKRLLAETRLLTLTGTGGCGKTKLALQVAIELAGTYPDGIWLVELASLADPELVPGAVAAALGVREGPGQPIRATVLSHLRSQRLLLVLDNCEHLIAACADLVAAVLRACAGVQFLATSREPLRIAGEVSWRVPSLALPAIDDPSNPTGLLTNEAVRLFLERARASQPGFALSDRDAEVVARICQRLDGIPLAIELAATRITTLSVQQIAARLDQRFRLLTSPGRAVLPRQQTLAALVGWSYDLLSEAERTLFNRLSVFAGSFSLEAAEAVCSEVLEPVLSGAKDTGSWVLGSQEGEANISSPSTQYPTPSTLEDVLGTLSELVEKSLVVAEPGPEGQRYHLLETLRQYGQERLIASGEADWLQQRHAAYFHTFALDAEPHLLAREQLTYLARLDRELDNLRAVLRWYLDNSLAQEGLRLQLGLVYFWWFRGLVTESHLWIERFLALPGAERTASRAVALSWAGRRVAQRGDRDGFRRLSAEAIALAREVSDRPALAETLLRYGYFVEHKMGRRPLEESLAIWRELGNRWKVAECLAFLGHIAAAERNLPRARADIEESLSIARGIGERHMTAVALEFLGELEMTVDPVKAFSCLTESQVLYHELGDRLGVASIEYLLGRLDYFGARYASAREHFRVCLRMSSAWAWMLRIAQCLEGLTVVAIERGEADRALRLAAASAYHRSVAYERSQLLSHMADLERGLEQARTSLGKAAADTIWAEGQAMTLEQAIAYALEDDSS
jgi:non-specific serine/threonine protein kinase